MEINLSSPEKVWRLLVSQEGWSDDEGIDLLTQFYRAAFAAGSQSRLKHQIKRFKRVKDLDRRRMFKEFKKELDTFNDTISILKLQAQHG